MQDSTTSHPSSEALGWLLELEMIQNPTLINALVLNIFKTVKGLKNTEFIADTKDKKILVLLELKPFSKYFFEERIKDEVKEILDQALPAFKKRVITDRALFDKALAITRGRNDDGRA